MSLISSAAFVALLTVGGIGCAGDGSAKHLAGYTVDPPTVVGDLSLPDAVTGKPFRFVAEPEGVLVVYFGYTFCPDVCPTTLAALRTALHSLGDDAHRVRLAMTTIDPLRDTAEVLPGYVQSFVPDATALRTDDDTALRTVTDRFGASYSVAVAADGTEDVSHSGSMYLVNEAGTVLDTIPFGVTPKAIASDLGILLHQVST